MTDLQRPSAPAAPAREGTAEAVTDEAKSAASTAAEEARQTASATVESASQVATTAAEGTRQVASEAAQRVTEVTQQASEQARQFAQRAQGEVREQAASQTQRAATGLRDLAQQFRGLADGQTESGFAADAARQLGDNVNQFAERLEERGFDGTVDDLRQFASRRPGLFLLGAAAAGFVTVRLGRGLQAADHQDASDGQTRPPQLDPPAATPGAAVGGR